MNKEYYRAKADLCRDLAIKQMVDGNSGEAGKNLIRMVNALNQIELIKYKEEKNETDKLL
jgi:N-acetyl-gamma-glutamylphosphate reductase